MGSLATVPADGNWGWLGTNDGDDFNQERVEPLQPPRIRRVADHPADVLRSKGDRRSRTPVHRTRGFCSDMGPHRLRPSLPRPSDQRSGPPVPQCQAFVHHRTRPRIPAGSNVLRSLARRTRWKATRGLPAPVADEAIRWHLSGQDDSGRDFVVGIYPMLQDETCFFLAVDFDKAHWCEDAGAFVETCLQENGCFVLRFLAEDSGKHLDEILDAILRTPCHRRSVQS
jgi:hypothetical protein